MLPLRPNPETGFLESNRESSFSSVMKVKFLEIAKGFADRKMMPDVGDICKEVGISIRTYWKHVALDAKFAEAWEEIVDICESSLVSKMYEYGQRPSNYMDRITWLKNMRPERWDPEQRVRIIQDSPGQNRLIDAIKGAIDADIVGELKAIEGTPPTSSLQDNQSH